MSPVWAAFDFPAAPPRRDARSQGVFRHRPAQILRADTPAQVPQVLAAAHAHAIAGRWVLGGVPYSGAHDPDQQVRRAAAA